MTKKCCIYVRVSSEAQAEKVSPEEQERSCLELAESRGYHVVEIYKDTKRYRVGKKMVEPSGTRSDRPEFRRMLEDARAGKFQVILAHREDRLYRVMRPMIDFVETLEATGATCELVAETFDAEVAPIRAWAAKRELKAIADRMRMGVIGRLRQGRLWDMHRRYAYQLDAEGRLVVDESRAVWVRRMYGWYIERVPVREIRRRLLEGAPLPDRKSGEKVSPTTGWSLSTIQHILTAPAYWQGFLDVSRGGVKFRVGCPPIVSRETFEKVQALRSENQAHAAGQMKGDFLCHGIVYCACGQGGRRWGVRTYRFRARGVLRKTPLGKYTCPLKSSTPDSPTTSPDCPAVVGAKTLDSFMWDFILRILMDPGRLMQAVDEATRRGDSESDLMEDQAEMRRLESELEKFPESRDRAISMAVRGLIPEAKMTEELEKLDSEEERVRDELRGRLERRASHDSLREWAKSVVEFTSRVDIEDLLTYDDYLKLPAGEREMHFRSHRELVEFFIERVVVHRDREPEVFLKYDIGASTVFNELKFIENHVAYRGIKLGDVWDAEVSVAR